MSTPALSCSICACATYANNDKALPIAPSQIKSIAGTTILFRLCHLDRFFGIVLLRKVTVLVSAIIVLWQPAKAVRMKSRLLSLVISSAYVLTVSPAAQAFSAELSRHVTSVDNLQAKSASSSSSENVRLAKSQDDKSAKQIESRGRDLSTALSASVANYLGDDFDEEEGFGEDEEDDDEPTVASCLRPLIRMTRPSNFPGVILFHVLGVHRALSAGLSSSSIPLLYSKSLLLETLRRPQMIVVALALLLTSATSMVINDYYDARSGTDARNLLTQDDNTYNQLDKPLATGDVPMIVAKRFLSYLYAALLVCLCAVPGIPSRLTVVVGSMLTFFYTQHLKPRTWLKNVSCAGLIALSPFTSGSAALSLVLDGVQNGATGSPLGSIGPAFGSLWRLVLTLFAGFMSREILMDVCDYDGDMETGIRTVPVKFGKRFATQISLAFASVLAVLATGFPALGILLSWDSVVAATSSNKEAIGLVLRSPVARKFLLAAIGSGMIIRRALQVVKTEGGDINIVAKAVDEQKTSSVLFILASFI